MKLFAGPSLDQEARMMVQDLEIELLTPIRRFDLPNLLATGYRGSIAIVDGYFFQDMAVGHAEIREALNAGCEVWGLSSMGAIRAFEMRSFGMKGFGKVYDWFFSSDDFQDDEVALLHGPAPEYYRISEPLVHFRECLKQLKLKGEISKEVEEKVLLELKPRFFGERSLNLFIRLLESSASIDAGHIKANFDSYRIKTTDLKDFLRSLPSPGLPNKS